jgi:D-aspartate ligase
MSSKRAEVVIGHPREVSGFSIIRSLRKIGVPIGVYDSHPKSAGLYVKGLSFSEVLPDPELEESLFIEKLILLGDRERRPVLIDLESAALEVVGRYQDELREHFRLLIPSAEILDIALDKWKTVDFFTRNRLGAPVSVQVTDESSVSLYEGAYPAVFKPRRGKGGRGQVVVRSESEAVNFYRTLTENHEGYILQEWIPGPVTNLHSCGILCSPGGEINALFTGQRLGVTQTARVPEGVTSYIRSVRIEDLIEVATTFARESGWTGMAEFEFKKDDRDDTFKILEINPRFWAWVQLPVSCGIDFPLHYFKMAAGTPCEPALNFRENVYYFRFLLYLYTQWYRFRSRQSSLKTFTADLAKPYLNLFRKNRSTVFEDFKFRREYVRWFTFYIQDSVL